MAAQVAPASAALSCPPAAPVHAWMPVSPCVPSCVAVPAEAGTLRVIARIASAIGLLASFPAAHLATPRRYRPRLHRRYARALLRCCGVRLRVVDQCGAGGDGPQQGLLVVSHHIGWTDILALAAVHPMGFVARADLIDWPLMGRVARLMRVVPIHRERLRQLPEVVAEIAARLAAGERVAMFPEGTTWCGRAHGALRPALFQAAVDAGAAIQPVRLRYLDRAGELSTVSGFVGDDSLVDSIRRVLRSKRVVAELVLLPQEQPGIDRHDLARRCEQAMRGPEALDIDAHATAVGTGPVREIVPHVDGDSTTLVP
jgi:1-acyl-sn-glycerol-3-phosphate acyltransferase